MPWALLIVALALLVREHQEGEPAPIDQPPAELPPAAVPPTDDAPISSEAPAPEDV